MLPILQNEVPIVPDSMMTRAYTIAYLHWRLHAFHVQSIKHGRGRRGTTTLRRRPRAFHVRTIHANVNTDAVARPTKNASWLFLFCALVAPLAVFSKYICSHCCLLFANFIMGYSISTQELIPKRLIQCFNQDGELDHKLLMSL
jgi:hypothetical protein